MDIPTRASPTMRSGTLRLNDRDYAVRVRNRSRGNPFYETDAGTVCPIDMNGDGVFAERGSVTVGGRSILEEQVIPRTPFVLDGQLLEITDTNCEGKHLASERTTERLHHVGKLQPC